MNGGKAAVAAPGSWSTYRRLLGYTGRYWAIGLLAFVGMLVDGGGLALFTGLLKPMIDKLFALKEP
jgi:subfamily B ATP-binding cassette protein MsbA